MIPRASYMLARAVFVSVIYQWHCNSLSRYVMHFWATCVHLNKIICVVYVFITVIVCTCKSSRLHIWQYLPQPFSILNKKNKFNPLIRRCFSYGNIKNETTRVLKSHHVIGDPFSRFHGPPKTRWLHWNSRFLKYYFVIWKSSGNWMVNMCQSPSYALLYFKIWKCFSIVHFS